MKVEILEEAGFDSAMFGLSLSKQQSVWRIQEVSHKLYSKDFGHNKFLEHIEVWLKVTAPRFWWQEADTYRLCSKQSDSTMHTIHKALLTQENFEYPIFPTTLAKLNMAIAAYGADKSVENLLTVKNNLPEGFLSTREWKMSYKELRNIISQRITHRLPQWLYFCQEIQKQIKHPEYFSDLFKE
ncbi:MAG: hypothetical protein PHO27_12175 [Sulfuricurvum sp.]|nr:hypothetical protein [Sulfuricurvum sp.]